jgi:hypothetical protein
MHTIGIKFERLFHLACISLIDDRGQNDTCLCDGEIKGALATVGEGDGRGRLTKCWNSGLDEMKSRI